MPRVLGGSSGGGRFLMGEVPLYEFRRLDHGGGTSQGPSNLNQSPTLLKKGNVGNSCQKMTNTYKEGAESSLQGPCVGVWFLEKHWDRDEISLEQKIYYKSATEIHLW